MNRAGMAIVVTTLFCMSAAAQPQAGAQAGAQGSSQTSVQAGQTQVQASADVSASTSASTQNGQANGSLASGTAFNAALSSPIDSKKCKPGDAVNARTTEAVKAEGRTVIPKGAKLVGHVTQASARAKGESESALGIVFDKAILKNGQEIPLSVGIQALAAAQISASAAGSDFDAFGDAGASAAGSGAAGGRGALGGVTSAAGGAVGAVTNTAANVGGVAGGAVNSAAGAGGGIGSSKGAVGGLNAAGQLTSNSQGVFGLNGLNLNAAASNATQGSLITSAGKNVHLESGTRMLLVSQAQAGSQSGEAKQPAAGRPESRGESKPEVGKPNKQ